MEDGRKTGLRWIGFCVLVCLAHIPFSIFDAPAHARQRGAKEKKNPLSQIDVVIEKAIAADEIPGAVVLVGQLEKILYRKAYGNRALVPQREAMTVDTIFDLASLTKVLATATSVMKLVEEGQVRLNDPVARYIPEFGANGKEGITVRHLLTHTGGLRPIPRLPEKWNGAEEVLRAINEDSTLWPPGMRFVYSDCGFIVLGELVRRVSGMPLDEFAAKKIFEWLGMKHTRFNPPKEWAAKIAPTEEIELPQGAKAGEGKGRVLRGEVHDPRARGMGGVAGHAGLFSTADDLGAYCRMILNLGGFGPRSPAEGAGGLWPGVLDQQTGLKMVLAATPNWMPTKRGLGWDIDSVYSAPRGELYPVGSFGHTGFTGTSVWIDYGTRTFVVLLTNSVHPRVRPAISSLRSKVATVVAAAHPGDIVNFHGLGYLALHEASEIEPGIGTQRPYDHAGVLTRNAETKAGIDVLVEENFATLKGKQVGLITNHTGVARDGRSTIDLLHKAEGVKLAALFSPEHGIAGREDTKVSSGTDAATGLAIHSLYGETRRPTEEMLKGVDALVFDIQDAGVRFYTYITTMAYAMEEAAKRKIPFYVLDRPNPLGGEAIEGPMLDADRLSFVGYFPMPVRYAMTPGELAQMFNAENKIGAELHVMAMKDYRRSDWYENTGLTWIAPSPALRNLDAALLYPGIELLQSGGVAVGRGTDTPFELFGAPWIKGVELARELNQRFLPGVRFVPVRFTPKLGTHRDQPCEGVSILITDRASLHSMWMGLEIAAVLYRLYPEKFAIDKIVTLAGNAETVKAVKNASPRTGVSSVVAGWQDDLEAFKKIRAKYLVYK